MAVSRFEPHAGKRCCRCGRPFTEVRWAGTAVGPDEHFCANCLFPAVRAEALSAMEEELQRLRDQLHDVHATPMAEWVAELAAARENVAGTAALLAEAERERDAARRAADAEAYGLDKMKAERDEARVEVDRLLAGHGERKVCEHRVEAGGDGACSDCYGFVVDRVRKLEEALGRWVHVRWQDDDEGRDPNGPNMTRCRECGRIAKDPAPVKHKKRCEVGVLLHDVEGR